MSSRERSEPGSLPQSVLGEGQARSARERAPRGRGIKGRVRPLQHASGSPRIPRWMRAGVHA